MKMRQRRKAHQRSMDFWKNDAPWWVHSKLMSPRNLLIGKNMTAKQLRRKARRFIAVTSECFERLNELRVEAVKTKRTCVVFAKDFRPGKVAVNHPGKSITTLDEVDKLFDELTTLAMPRTTTFTRPYDTAMHTKTTESGDQAMKKFCTAAREPISDAELGRLMLDIPHTVIRPDLPIDPLKD